jgi:hypothetical protein
MDEIEGASVVSPDGNEGQKKNLLQRLGKKGLALSIAGILLVVGGTGGYFYNYKITQGQKKDFADGCFKLGLALTEDFDDYENGLYYPLSYFRNQTEHSQKYDSITNGLTDYRYLSTQNSRYSGAKESAEIVMTLKQHWMEFLEIKEKREGIERSNPDVVEIGLLVRIGFNALGNIFLYDLDRSLAMGRKADKLHFGYFNSRWTAQDESEFTTAISNYNQTVTSLRSICGTARAGNR